MLLIDLGFRKLGRKNLHDITMLEPSMTVTANFSISIQALAVAADGVATVDALVAVLGADRVCVASVDHWKLGKPFHGLLSPTPPKRTMAVPVARDNPGGGVAHFVDQGVSQSIRRVNHLCRELNPGSP